MKRNKKNNKKKQQQFRLSSLKCPILSEITPKCYRGVKQTSNWIIPNKFLVGGYPISKEMDGLLKVANCDTFICLVSDHETRNFYQYWRKLPPNCQYIWHPIPDGSVLSDSETIDVVDEIIKFIENGRIVYMHCLGGHGRTGYLVCLVLSKIFKIDADKSFELCQKMHDCRKKTNSQPSPETKEQRKAVIRIIKDSFKKK